MGFFDFLKKPKSDVELYYEEREKQEKDTWYSCAPQKSVPFRITVEDVFSVTGRGTVVVGRVESGSIYVGETVTLQRTNGSCRSVMIIGIEMFRKMVQLASTGDQVGILLREISRNEIAAGDILVK